MVTKQDFHLVYSQFIQQYGVLFEKNEVPLTELERKKTSQYYWFILFFFITFSALGGVTYYFNAAKGVTVGMLVFVIFDALIVGSFYFSLRNTLKRGKKVIIKAVVTSKKSGKSNEIGLSGQEYVGVSSVEYDTLDFGDIIQVDKVGTFITFTHSITKLGSIFDPASISNANG